MQTACNKYFDEISVKLQDCLRIFEQNVPIEDIQKMIKQFMTDVERDTNRRNTIKIKQFEKGKRINDGEFARLSSLSKRSSNGSDRAMTNRQNLRLDDPIKMG